MVFTIIKAGPFFTAIECFKFERSGLRWGQVKVSVQKFIGFGVSVIVGVRLKPRPLSKVDQPVIVPVAHFKKIQVTLSLDPYYAI